MQKIVFLIRHKIGLSASVVDSDNINEYEEEMKLNMFTINAQKLLRGR